MAINNVNTDDIIVAAWGNSVANIVNYQWKTIYSKQDVSSSYTWTIPTTGTKQFRIKISGVAFGEHATAELIKFNTSFEQWSTRVNVVNNTIESDIDTDCYTIGKPQFTMGGLLNNYISAEVFLDLNLNFCKYSVSYSLGAKNIIENGSMPLMNNSTQITFTGMNLIIEELQAFTN